MQQDIEAFLADWVQRHPPQTRKSDTQDILEKIVPTIAHLRGLGYGWAELAAMLAKAGVTDTNGRAMKAETLRRKAFRAGYCGPASDKAENRSHGTQSDETEARGSEVAGYATSTAVQPRSALTDTDKGTAARGGVFSTVRAKGRPRRLDENLTPYSTEDIIKDATPEAAETEGGQ